MIFLIKCAISPYFTFCPVLLFLSFHFECCDHDITFTHCLYTLLSMLFTTGITSYSQSTINDHDVSFLCDDDINDITVMKTVKSLLIPTIVIIATFPLFLNETNKNKHVPPHFLLLFSELFHVGLNCPPFTFTLVSVDSSLFHTQ